MLKKFQPKILHRFKGLGENDPEDLKVTIMDPNTRSLIKVTMDNYEEDMKVFRMLRGSSPMDSQNRKKLMAGYTLPMDLLDT